MPARLKSFELHGYKTFASRSEFQFSDGVTAIVGPNGSGKSNIADALRWVLGEQSYGLLRAKKTEDMIFSGSENRSRAGMASATIVFDNSDGWLPIDFVEVGITRRAYRDGENEYLLNGQRVRLKDVSEVLAKSGLAERTYTVIGQGLVDAALALRAEERRRLFEEAAGIGLHRARREEALKRLENTRRNLERVHDILSELQPRLRSLERQAKRAEDYERMRENLKVVLRQWYGYHWHKAQAELFDAQTNAKLQEDALSKVQSRQHELDQKLGEFRTQISELRTKLSSLHQELTHLHQRRETLSRDQAVNGERARLLIEQFETISKEKAKTEEELGIQKDLVDTSKGELYQLETDLQEANRYVVESKEKLVTRQEERSLIEDKIKALQSDLALISTREAQQRALASEKEIIINRMKDSLRKVSREIATREFELTNARTHFNNLSAEKQELHKDHENVSQKLKSIQEKLEVSALEQKSISEKISAQKTKVRQLQAEINMLEDAEKNLTGYDEGARILAKAVNDRQIDGAIGSLGNRLIIAEEYETAIAAILGEFVNSLVVESINQTDKALDLIGNETTRSSLFPLDVINPPKLLLDVSKGLGDKENIIGLASQLVTTDDILRPIISLLFGNVLVVRDRKTARSVLASGKWNDVPGFRVVTLKGEMYIAGGPIITGATGKGLLARPRQQREIMKILDQAKSDLMELDKQHYVITETIDELNKRDLYWAEKEQFADEADKAISLKISKQERHIERIQNDVFFRQEQNNAYRADIGNEEALLVNIHAEILKTQEESSTIVQEIDGLKSSLVNLPIDELQAQNIYWNTNSAVIEQALTDAKNRQVEKSTRLREVEDTLSGITLRSTNLENEIKSVKEKFGVSSTEETQIAKQIEELGKVVDPYEEQLNLIEREHSYLLDTDTSARRLLREAEQNYTQSKINLAHRQETFESLRRHIEDDFGLVAFDYMDTVSGPKPLPIKGMIDELPKVEVLTEEIEESIRQQKAQMRRMGSINPEAQAEYREVKERFEFLTSQVEDLSKAEEDIREVISELDLLMEREFKRTFNEVSSEFKQIFTRLFGGGSAKLALTDPENVTETGIDIEARLPGRREQGLSLLSGGERSLTAAALIFALLRVSPTPFCILDEVDAMLDEANVSRFRDLLTELSEKTQFIVITHNRNTVQAASIIYGVTMGRDSASQVISLRMDELGEEFGV